LIDRAVTAVLLVFVLLSVKCYVMVTGTQVCAGFLSVAGDGRISRYLFTSTTERCHWPQGHV